MIENLIFLLLSITAQAEDIPQHDRCEGRILSHPTVPARLSQNTTKLAEEIHQAISQGNRSFSAVAKDLLQRNEAVLGLAYISPSSENALALNVSKRLKIFPNRTLETKEFWSSLNVSRTGWGAAFKECDYLRSWVYCFVLKTSTSIVGVFVKVEVDQCDERQSEIFNGTHKCHRETMQCVNEAQALDERGRYRCMCRKGFYHRSANLSWNGFTGKEVETIRIDNLRCLPCPDGCEDCGPLGICSIQKDVYVTTAILCIQLACMTVVIVVTLIVFKQRKTKAIATGMWTILETILMGIFILYSTVVIKSFEPSTAQCLLEPWFREVGFVICYGAIILKLYRHLIEFRTRKAHRWVVKDTDLLKYLLIMTMSVLGYMAAYTSITLNFMQENYSLLYIGSTLDGERYYACKYLWWDYVTETGEVIILVFGIHLSYASRNARTQFHERTFLTAAISLEMAVSIVFYLARAVILPGLHPDTVLIIYCIRTQMSQTMALLLIFVPKFWYQQKQVRNLAQEYSCRLPVDAFKDINAHGPLTSNNSDADVGEITLADMSPDDIRAELKRLYLQLELFKSKTICRDNPHISKRRGGRKAQHRRFSLQNLHGKHKDKERQKLQEELTEAEPSRTPEDSVCSNEGPSAIYADLPSSTFAGDQK